MMTTATTTTRDGKIMFKLRSNASSSTGEDEVRRLALDHASLDTLRAKAKALFHLPDHVAWHFTWTDEEGDQVMMTEEEELLDAIQEAARLSRPTIALRVRVDPSWRSNHPPSLAGSFPFLASPLPRCWRNPCRPYPGPGAVPKWRARTPRRVAVYGARCDETGKALRVGDGEWHHKAGSSIDICAEGLAKLGEEEKLNFTRVDKPEDLGADMERYLLGFALPSSSAEGKGKREEAAWAEVVGGSLVAICDKTDQELGLGRKEGWYHKMGHNFDLCAAAFEDLSEEEKAGFIKVESLEDLGRDGLHYLPLPPFFRSFLPSFPSSSPSSPPHPPSTTTEQASDKPMEEQKHQEEAAPLVEQPTEDVSRDESGESDGSGVVVVPRPQDPTEQKEEEEEEDKKEENKAALLMQMGLGDEELVQFALSKSNGDVNAAALMLLNR